MDRIDADAELAPMLDQYFKIVTGGDDDLLGPVAARCGTSCGSRFDGDGADAKVLNAKLLIDPSFPRVTVEDLGALIER